MIPTDKNCQDHLRPMKRPRNEMQEMTDLIYTYAEDVANIEDLRRRDVAASIAGEFENLKSLMFGSRCRFEQGCEVTGADT
jgi:hypothetical protein